MTRVRIHKGVHVLACDGSKALLLRNEGEANALDLRVIDVAFETHPPTRELGSERPGRVHESAGVSRSAVANPDLHTAAEVAFLLAVADKLAQMVRDGAITHVVLVAPPKALGVLRPRLPAPVKARLVAEIGKDLARLPTAEIQRHLAVLAA